jgi:hypothetical protein
MAARLILKSSRKLAEAIPFGISTSGITIVEPDERSKDCSLRSLLFDSLAG